MARVVEQVSVQLFGGVDVVGPLGSTSFGGPKQRAIVARLALDAGHIVAVDQLVDDVWGTTAPQTVRASLHVHISQIRRKLAECGVSDVLATRPAGYVLDLPPGSVDVTHFEELVRSTLSHLDGGRHEEATTVAFEAIALWTADPLIGIASAPFAQPRVTGLVERRIELSIAAADAAIVVGRANDLVRELELVANEHPYREPLWAALARVLYATDRQTDALDRLTTLRRTMRDELGLDPTAAIVHLEHEILNHGASMRGASPARPRSVGRALRSHLPAPRPLVGREGVLGQLAELADRPGQVTLLGPAGVGKTALGVTLAHRAAGRRRDGATFVDLASLAEDDDVIRAITAALSLRPTSAAENRSEVCDLLRTRDAVLVLDNCEHVRSPVSSLLNDLAGAPSLTVLTTSRIPIEAVLEQLVAIAPLAIEDAVDMFLERAVAADPAYEPTDADHAAIHELVEEVDGLALGIELLASLSRTMTPREILDHVRRTRGPTAPRPPGLARHRSMDDAIDRSVELLGARARELFARIGLVRGGTNLRATHALAGDTFTEVDVVDALRELVDASLLVAERTPTGTWFRMLYPIQLSAAARVKDPTEGHRTLQRFVRHLVAELKELSLAIEGPEPAAALAGIERRSAGIRQAYALLHEAGDRIAVHELLAALGPVALAATSALPEAADWFADELPNLGDATPAHRVRIELGVLWYGRLTPTDYRALAEECVGRARALGDRSMLVFALAMLVDAHTDHDSERGVALGLEMMELARRGDRSLLGLALNFILNPMLRTLRLAEAEALLTEAFATGIDQLGVYEPQLHYQAGRLALLQGDLDAADRHNQAAARAALHHGSVHGHSYVAFGEARLAAARGDFRLAQSRFLTALEFDRIVSPREIWGDLTWAAIVSIELGDEATIRNCIAGFVATDRPMEACGLETAHACLHLVGGDDNQARHHLLRAMELVADVASLAWFGDLIKLWARTCDLTGKPILDQLAADVRERRVTPSEAISVLKSTAPIT